MSDTVKKEEILRKVIEKAWNNGWIWEYDAKKVRGEHWLEVLQHTLVDALITPDLSSWIFSHDFAKAFWGSEMICTCVDTDDYISEPPDEYCTHCMVDPNLEEWQYHLQQMVLEEDPVKYLEKFL